MSGPRTRLQHRRARQKTTWHHLPPELRNMILGIFVASHEADSTSRISPYAAVCHEWHAFFEPVAFKTLVLHQSDVHKLGVFTQGRRHLVKHIWLRFELEPYDCLSCGIRISSRPEEDASMPGWFFRRSIQRLLHALGHWDEKECAGLTLELSIHSPSDSQHFFPHFCFGSRPDALGACSSSQLLPRHRIGGQPLPPALHMDLFTVLARFRVFGCPLTFDTFVNLPRVGVVKRLVIRRQTRRNLFPSALSHILRALPALESLNYEPWSYETYSVYREISPELEQGTSFSLPEAQDMSPCMKELTIFEDFLQKPHTPFSMQVNDIGGRHRRLRHHRSVSLAKTTRYFESVAVAFAVDAMSFFGALEPGLEWSKLRFLSLTSEWLRPQSGPERARILICAAAPAAERMPNLDTMELWIGDKNLACLFRYRARDGAATLLWRATWRLEFPVQMVRAWEAVAARNADLPLRVERPEILGSQSIGSHGDAIASLGLKIAVADPVSVRQIQWETGGYQGVLQ